MTVFWGLLGVIAGVTPLWPVFQSPSFVVAVAAGILLGALVATVVRWRRWPWWSVIPGLVLAFAIFGVPVAVPSATFWRVIPTLDGEGQLFGSVVTGWKQLVTIAPPVGDFAGLLVPVFVLTLISSAAVVLLARRERWSALTALPSLVTLGLSIWLGTGDLALAVPAGVIVALSMLGVFMRRVPGTAVRRIGAVAISLGLVVATGLGALAIAQTPDLWRQRVTPTLDDRSLPSPLSDYRAYLTGDLATVPMMSIAGAAPTQMLSLATLSRYDGITYTVGAPDGDFARQSGFTTSAAADNEVTVRIDQLTGPWVPLPTSFDGLRDVTAPFESLYYSASANTAVDLNGLHSGLSYTVAGRALESQPVTALTSSSPGQATTAVLDVPSGVEAFVAAHSTSTDPPGVKLADTLTALTSAGYLSHGGQDEAPSRSGHSAERITALLTDKVMVGDAEQYAVAAALLAQQVGYPARVVVGFVMPESGELVHGSDFGAWVEVATTDGWVAVDPTPEYRPIPEAPPDDPQRVSPPQPAVEPPPADTSQVRDNAAPRSDERDPVAPPDPWRDIVLAILTVGGWILLVVAVALIPPLTILLIKIARRRRRRLAPDARTRVLGARDELADVLVDGRVAVTPATTHRELLELAGVARSSLVALADRADYSLESLDASDAENAWSEVSVIERGLSRPLGRWQRLRRALSLRSLFRRRFARARR